MKIGILGGTFNPVHIGHLILAQDAMETFELDRIFFVACARPPHKPAGLLAPDEHRVAMLERALAGNPNFESCDLELRRGGTSYTVDTVRELQKQHPGDEFAFIIGSDTLPELRHWKEVDTLLGLCRFLTACRPGFDPQAFAKQDLGLAPARVEALLAHVFRGHQVEVSSSDIRYRAAEGMSLRYLVPESVEIYISEHRLYVK
jgi:nicotinate-nucleotide adenylyltransferase